LPAAVAGIVSLSPTGLSASRAVLIMSSSAVAGIVTPMDLTGDSSIVTLTGVAVLVGASTLCFFYVCVTQSRGNSARNKTAIGRSVRDFTYTDLPI
jgi:ABC-type arginine/histidine transport system permease subunit